MGNIGVIELVIMAGILVVLAGGGVGLALFLNARNKRQAQRWQPPGGQPPPGYPRQGHPRQGYPPPGYPPQHPQTGYPPQPGPPRQYPPHR